MKLTSRSLIILLFAIATMIFCLSFSLILPKISYLSTKSTFQNLPTILTENEIKQNRHLISIELQEVQLPDHRLDLFDDQAELRVYLVVTDAATPLNDLTSKELKSPVYHVRPGQPLILEGFLMSLDEHVIRDQLFVYIRIIDLDDLPVEQQVLVDFTTGALTSAVVDAVALVLAIPTGGTGLLVTPILDSLASMGTQEVLDTVHGPKLIAQELLILNRSENWGITEFPVNKKMSDGELPIKYRIFRTKETTPEPPIVSLPTKTNIDPPQASHKNISASGYANDSNDACMNRTSFIPSNVIDGDPTTAWRVESNGQGEWLRIEFGSEIIVDKIGIIPGYAKTDPCDGTDRFEQNYVLKRARLEFSNGQSVECTFQKQRMIHYFEIGGIRTSYVRIVVLDTYPPSNKSPRYFTAISEVEIISGNKNMTSIAINGLSQDTLNGNMKHNLLSYTSASGYANDSNDACMNRTSFVPSNAIDGDATTAWRVEGNGQGEWLRIEFGSALTVDKIGIISGYAKTDPCDGTDRFEQNYALKRARLEFSNGQSVECTFQKQRMMHYFEIGGIRTNYIRIVILDTYLPSNKSPRYFTAISEVEVIGHD